METLKDNWALIYSKLEQIKPTSNGIDALCPAHDDKTASLSARLEINRGIEQPRQWQIVRKHTGALLHLNRQFRSKYG